MLLEKTGQRMETEAVDFANQPWERIYSTSEKAKRGLNYLISPEKRWMDIGAALPGSLLAAIVAIGVGIMIKKEDGGTILYNAATNQVGGAESYFKFRTMVVGAAAQDRKLTQQMGSFRQVKINGDPRLTRVGTRLRRLSIDELPQAFSVLRGHISLVGPKPLTYSEFEELDESLQADYLEMKQRELRGGKIKDGVFGPYVLMGRAEAPLEARVRADLEYAEKATLVADYLLIRYGIPMVLSGRGAY